MKQAFLILILFSLFTHSFAQEKIGYIDVDSVVQNMPIYNLGQKEIQEYVTFLEDSLYSLWSDLENRIHTDPNRDWTEEELSSYNDKVLYAQIQTESLQLFAQDTLSKLEAHVQKNLMESLKEEMRLFAEKEGILLLGIKKDVLYCPDCVDYSNRFIKYIRNKTYTNLLLEGSIIRKYLPERN